MNHYMNDISIQFCEMRVAFSYQEYNDIKISILYKYRLYFNDLIAVRRNLIAHLVIHH